MKTARAEIPGPLSSCEMKRPTGSLQWISVVFRRITHRRLEHECLSPVAFVIRQRITPVFPDLFGSLLTHRFAQHAGNAETILVQRGKVLEVRHREIVGVPVSAEYEHPADWIN